MRYVGQAYELEVPITSPVTAERVPGIVAAFHAVHERVYGYARAQQPAEFVNFRAVHIHSGGSRTGPPSPPALDGPGVNPGPSRPPALSRAGPGASGPGEAVVGQRDAHFTGGFVPTAIYDRARLPEGARLTGPAIVEQTDTTTVIPPGYAATVDAASNLRIRRR
jgi:N-methylhydantoinase A